MNLKEKELIVNAIKDTHGIEEWQDEMMFKKHWQNVKIAKKIVNILVEEIRIEKIAKLETELLFEKHSKKII